MSTAGDHWVLSGLSPIPPDHTYAYKWQLKWWHINLISTSLIIKLIVNYLTPYPDYPNFAFYTGDILYFLGDPFNRLYIKATYMGGAIACFLLSIYVPHFMKAKDFAFLSLFKEIKLNVENGLLDKLHPLKKQLFLKACNLVFSSIVKVPLSMGFALASFSTFYLSQATLLTLPIALFWVLYIFVWCTMGFLLHLLTAFYFFLICLYTTFAMKQVNSRLLSINQVWVEKFRKLERNKTVLNEACLKFSKSRRLFFARKTMGVLNDFEDIIVYIRQCDRFFSKLLLIIITPLSLGATIMVYAFFHAESFTQALPTACITMACFCPVSACFFIASALHSQLTKTYKLLHSLSLCQTSRAFKWKLLMKIELISSSKQRIGFRIKHVFRLTTLNWFRTVLTFSSLYMKLIEFANKF